MRITYLSVSDQLGGSEIVLLEMISGIRRLRPDWNLQVILPGRGPLLDRAVAAGADCTVVPMPSSLARLGESGAGPAGWPPASFPWRSPCPAISIACAPSSRPAGPRFFTRTASRRISRARARKGREVVWHMHEYVGARRVARSLLARHQHAVAAMVANSASVAADVTGALRPSVPVQVVHNAVDLRTFSPDGPIEDLDRRAGLMPAATGVVRVGLISTFARWKGHDVFLRALAAIPGDVPVRGYVIGGPLYDTAGSQHSMEELQAQADRLGLGVASATVLLQPGAARGSTSSCTPAPVEPLASSSRRPWPAAAVITSASGGGELVTAGEDA